MNRDLKKILLKTKRAFFSENVGNNLSIFKGEGYDFAELKEYSIGDDIRHIDWIISAKLQKPFVKVFHSQRELRVGIVPLLCGSTLFGSKESKQEKIAFIASILGFSAIKNGDSIYGGVFSEEFLDFIPLSKRFYSWQKLISQTLEFNPISHKIDYENLVKSLFTLAKKRSILFLIGDFFDKIDLSLLSKKQEVIVLVVRDRFEENPSELGYVNLIDPNSGDNYELMIDRESIKNYKSELQKRDKELLSHCRKNRVKYCKIYSDENPLIKLSALLR